MNKNLLGVLMLAFLLALPGPLPAATASAPAPASAPADASGAASLASETSATPGFPLRLKGTEILIHSQLKGTELESRLQEILGEKTQMEEKTRLQYDFQADPEEAPMTVLIDLDARGAIAEVALEATSESQNPPARDLKAWLLEHSGPGTPESPKTKKNPNPDTIWVFSGWRFAHHVVVDEGEDSAFSFRIVPAAK